jgi:hypothetical protein
MTTPNKILVELLDISATADAVAERVRVPMLVAQAMLQRHAKDGLVSSHQADLTTWKLTESGQALAASLQPTCTP